MGDEVQRLIEQIEREPEEISHYLVLADALQQLGDSRGELIHVQRALEERARGGDDHVDMWSAAERERVLLAERRTAALGELARERGITLAIRLGFVEGITLSSRSRPEACAAALAALCGSPEGRLLRTVTIDPQEHGGPFVDDLLDALLATPLRLPRALRKLVIGTAFWDDGSWRTHTSCAPTMLDCVLLAFDGIRELELDLGATSLSCGELASPHRERFVWISPFIERDSCAALAGFDLPALASFALWSGGYYAPPVGAFPRSLSPSGVVLARSLGVRELDPIFAMLDGCPGLRELGLCNLARDAASILGALATHSCLAGLAVLDVSESTLSDADVRALVELVRGLPALEKLRIDNASLSVASHELLVRSVPVVVEGTPEPDHRDLTRRYRVRSAY